MKSKYLPLSVFAYTILSCEEDVSITYTHASIVCYVSGHTKAKAHNIRVV